MKTQPSPNIVASRGPSLLLPALVVSLCGSAAIQAQTVILWNGPVNDVAGGDWSSASNWAGLNVPDAATEQADLRRDWGGTTAGTPNLTLGSSRTLNGILFDDTGATGDRTLTINAGSELTLAGTSPVLQIDGSTLILTCPLGGSANWSKTGGGTLGLDTDNAASYGGAITVSEGTLDVRNVNALGNTAAGTTVAAGARVFFGNLVTGATVPESFVIAGTGTGNNGALNVGGNKTINLSGPITLSADALLKADGGSALNLTNSGGVTAVDKNLTFTVDNSLASSISGPLALGSGGFTKTSGSTLNLNGNNSYTGPTLVSGGTLNLAGGSGAILSTSSITASGGTLGLANATANSNRIADTRAVNLTLGGALSLTANTSANITETIGALVLGNSTGTVSVASAASRVNTLAASTFTRGPNRATGLVRGTSLSQNVATNVARITLADGGASLGLVGSNTLAAGGTSDATQALRIVPWLFGDTSATGGGNGFLTYDSTLGLRVLTATQTTDLTGPYVTAAQPDNASVTADVTVDNLAGITVNSLLFRGTAATTLQSAAASPLTIDSGAIATTGNFAYTLGNGFSGIVLGNGEGIITVPTNTLTIAAPISVTAGGGLTKTGGNTLALTAANTYTGPTSLNQGTLSAAILADGGIASALGASGAAPENLLFNGGALLYSGATTTTDRGATLLANGTINVATTGTTLGISGDLTGAGTLIKAGVGSLALNTANSFTGNVQINGTANANTLAISHPEALGPAAAVKNITMTGSNRQFSLLELAGGITIDANKAINTAGKSSLAVNDSALGSPVFLRNAAGDNTWLGNVWITTTGGAYSIESVAGTLTLGSPGTTSTLRQSAGADTRVFEFRGGGDFVLNSQLINNGTSVTGIQKTGTGTLTLPRVDNTASSNPNLAAGTIVVESLAASGSPSSIGGGTGMNLGGTLRHVGAANSTTNRAVGLIGISPVVESAGTGSLAFTSATTVTYVAGTATTLAPFAAGATVVTANEVWNLIPGMTITGGGSDSGIAPGTLITAVDYDAFTLTLDTPTTRATLGGRAINTSAATAAGQPTIQLTPANASLPNLYVGMPVSGTNIPAGALINEIDPATGLITLSANLTGTGVASAASISFNAGGVTFSGAADQDRTLTLRGTHPGGNSFSPSLANPAGSGKLSLVKADAGTWSVSGSSSYGGTTTVSGGTLLQNGSHSGGGTYTVAPAATLGGTGSLDAAVDVNGTLAPGAGIEDLATGTITFGPNTTLAIEFNSSNLAADQLVVTGDVVTGGNTVNLTLADLGPNAPLPNGAKLVLVDYTGFWNDTDIVRFNGNPVPNGSTIVFGATTFTVDYSDDSLGGSAMTLTSINPATPFQNWVNGFTAELPNSADRLPGADPDRDGRDNLLEFALNGDPADGGNPGKIVFATDDSADPGSAPDLTLTLAVRDGAVKAVGPGGSVTLTIEGIVYTIQGSGNLATWDKAVNEVTPASPLSPAPGAGWTTRTFQVSDSNGLPDKRFVRVGVVQTP